jgi:hypothetical protein
MKDFRNLIATVEQVHLNLLASAANAVNKSLTIRNWLIGYFIVEFEQNGEDRAGYGENLLAVIADEINIKGLTAPELSRCRQFYFTYPQILVTLSQDFADLIPSQIFGTLPQKSQRYV